jgi:NAD(P)H-dependent flavin oxidoreductase YrpB (nitropropane dioxygenase family)
MRTPLCDLVGVERPIVQTGMGFVAYPPLVIAVSNAGGLGILASATMDFAELARAITAVKAGTDRPFGVNLRADAADAAQRIDLMGREGVRVASFAQAPKPELIARAKEAGMVVIPSIGAVRHAEKVAGWGADAVIVQGGEGGGHTGQVPTTLLLPQVVDAVGSSLAVIAAGGFFDGRGLVAALAYGAAGVAMGTRFLLTAESPVAANVKDVYLSKSVTDTVVSRQVDGVPHRVLRTPLVDMLEGSGRVRSTARAVTNAIAFRRLSKMPWSAVVREGIAMKRSQELTWSQVVMAANTPMLLKAAMVDGHPELGVMASGQVVGMIDDLPTCQELLDRVIGDADAILRKWATPLGTPATPFGNGGTL